MPTSGTERATFAGRCFRRAEAVCYDPSIISRHKVARLRREYAARLT